MNKYLIFLMISLLPLLNSCIKDPKDGHQFIGVVNKSNSLIVCQQLWSGSIQPGDSMYNCSVISQERIYPDAMYAYEASSQDGKWESDFEVIPYIQFIIMDGELFNKYRSAPCDTIRKYVPVLHVYRLTYKDLDSLNWIVVYPTQDN